MMEHKATSAELNTVRARLDESKAREQPVALEQERDFDLLKRKKNQLSAKIDAARDSGNTAARDAEISRRRVQQEILNDAHVICATLSGSGHEMFQNLSIEFETVIIDEAAQSIELSALIPLKYGCSKCIMVGDPKQLPPTVLSRRRLVFNTSRACLFACKTIILTMSIFRHSISHASRD
jgi:senataxin